MANNTRNDLLAKLEKRMVEKKQIIFKFSETEHVAIDIDTKFLNTTVENFVEEFFIYIAYMREYDKLDKVLEIYSALLIKYFSKIVLDDEDLKFMTDEIKSELSFKQLLDYNSSLKNIQDVDGVKLRSFILNEIGKNVEQLEKLNTQMHNLAQSMTENQEDIISIMKLNELKSDVTPEEKLTKEVENNG